MSWHASFLPKWVRENTPSFLTDPLPPLIWKLSNTPPPHRPRLVRVPYLPLKNQIFQRTPIIKLKVTKFLVKLSQFKFLVNTDKNIFVYKHFYLYNIFVYFFVFKYFRFQFIFYAKTGPPAERGGEGKVHYFRSIRITC